jgi:hypothetical protein
LVELALYGWAGVFIGAIIGTLWPYFNVLKANPETKFDKWYVASLVFAVFMAMPTTIVALALIQAAIPAALVAYAEDPWFIFVFGIAVGAGFDRYINEKIVDKGRA